MAEESKKELDSFSDWLVSSLRKCLSADQRSFVLRAEKIWAMFHQLRTSRDFRSGIAFLKPLSRKKPLRPCIST